MYPYFCKYLSVNWFWILSGLSYGVYVFLGLCMVSLLCNVFTNKWLNALSYCYWMYGLIFWLNVWPRFWFSETVKLQLFGCLLDCLSNISFMFLNIYFLNSRGVYISERIFPEHIFQVWTLFISLTSRGVTYKYHDKKFNDM